jgi:hypothetical protein
MENQDSVGGVEPTKNMKVHFDDLPEKTGIEDRIFITFSQSIITLLNNIPYETAMRIRGEIYFSSLMSAQDKIAHDLIMLRFFVEKFLKTSKGMELFETEEEKETYFNNIKKLEKLLHMNRELICEHYNFGFDQSKVRILDETKDDVFAIQKFAKDLGLTYDKEFARHEEVIQKKWEEYTEKKKQEEVEKETTN